MIPDISIDDYHYELPDERIAKYPLPERDASKLLIYRGAGEAVDETVFRNLPSLVPDGALMVFNDTKVVPARLFFRRDTGARIEIFCLEPESPSEYNLAFASSGRCSWKCVIGNAKRWKDDVLSYDIPSDNIHPFSTGLPVTAAPPSSTERPGMSELLSVDLKARLVSREDRTGVVEFSWKGGAPFSRILELCGQVPIPPYLNRDTEAIDLERYQTTYAHIRGSVAAPTAGLHFTERVIDDLKKKGVVTQTVCLHVGAGTFLPVKSSNVSEHTMHREPFVVSRELLEQLASNSQPASDSRMLIAVGTTSIRTLESLYYVGVSCIEKGEPEDVSQWAPYEREYRYTTAEAIGAIVEYLDRNGLEELTVGTRIIIVPGFRFRLVDACITNFHQPESTLILLIGALVGDDWRRIYDYALSHAFRFLSYGDSSFLIRNTEIK